MEIPSTLARPTTRGRCIHLGGGSRATMIRSLEPLSSSLANSTELSSFDPGRIDGERDPSPSLRETSTTRVQRIFPFFYFHISFFEHFGPFVFSGPNYRLSLSFLLVPLLGFIGLFLLGPNESYVHVCVCVGLF